jgi:hypothetical protein
MKQTGPINEVHISMEQIVYFPYIWNKLSEIEVPHRYGRTAFNLSFLRMERNAFNLSFVDRAGRGGAQGPILWVS